MSVRVHLCLKQFLKLLFTLFARRQTKLSSRCAVLLCALMLTVTPIALKSPTRKMLISNLLGMWQKKRKHRKHIILELFETERNYVEQLEQLVTIQHWLAGFWFFSDDAPYFLAEIKDRRPNPRGTSVKHVNPGLKRTKCLCMPVHTIDIVQCWHPVPTRALMPSTCW